MYDSDYVELLQGQIMQELPALSQSEIQSLTNKIISFKKAKREYSAIADGRAAQLDQEGISPDIHVDKKLLLLKRSRSLGTEDFFKTASTSASFIERNPLSAVSTAQASSSLDMGSNANF